MTYQDLFFFFFFFFKIIIIINKCQLQTMTLIGETRLFIDQKQTLGLASARVIWITRVYLP